MRGPYTYGGATFRTKGDLTDYLKKAVNYARRKDCPEEEFFDPVLADLIHRDHYLWRGRAAPTKFKFIANTEGDGRSWAVSLAACFPDFGWKRTSYRKALKCVGRNPEDVINITTEFERLCRERWKVWRGSLFREGTRCEHPLCNSIATDLDHVSPQHQEITKACLPLLSEKDRVEWWAWITTPSRSEVQHFVMPANHPTTVEYDRLTSATLFAHLCQPHHQEATRLRKRGEAFPVPGRILGGGQKSEPLTGKGAALQTLFATMGI